uniref:autotransporter family protein n=1 Tax=Brucella pseudintermedia TaxID=370111 RepID=UPI001F3527D8|nr:autotransporter outer membrane beta-barrel domain-containing protein [Brucella pseudintermedia]
MPDLQTGQRWEVAAVSSNGFHRCLLTSAAVALISIVVPSFAVANEWTGAINDDFFEPGNWDDSSGPQSASSAVNNGSAIGTIDLSTAGGASGVGTIGGAAGQTGSVRLDIITVPGNQSNSASIYFGNSLVVGTNQGTGTLTVSTDGNAQIYMGASAVSIGKGVGSEGTVNMLGTGKNLSDRPEGPFPIGSSCFACSPNFTSYVSDDYKVGTQGGTGTLNIDGSVLILEQRGEFVVGDGAGSNGTVNVLAGGKLGDGSPHFNGDNVNTLSKGKLTVGRDGGNGTINIDGTSAASRAEAALALFSKGLVIGNGQGSTGAVNMLSTGKVHSYINYDIGQSYPNYGTRADLDTRVGVDGGVGSITVSGAGAVWYQSGILDGYLGSSSATVTSDAATLRIGESGTGQLTIAEDGVVRIGTAVFNSDYDETVGQERTGLTDHVANGILLLGGENSGNGTLNIGGAAGAMPTAPGRLMAQTVEFGPGTGLVRFNHTANDYIFDQYDAQYLDGPSRPSTIILEGSGTVEAAAGRTLLNENQTAFTGTLLPSTGILQVNGDISTATADILSGGTLEGTGIVGATMNAGTIAPGQTPGGVQGVTDSIGTLTISGNYIGSNGVLSLDTVLGDDQSLTDRLVVQGDTSGQTSVRVKNVNGAGALTTEGIQVVNVSGNSGGEFSLLGQYVFEGQQAVVGGAYAYRLYKGGYSTPNDGNWYLRSQLIPVGPDPGPGPEPEPDPSPLYQPGVPTYEAYPQFLLGLNGLPTLRQRVGNRYWSNAGNVMLSEGADAIGSPYAPPEEAGNLIEGNGVWGRIEGSHTTVEPRFSTSDTDYRYNMFRLQAGLDGMLAENESGKLIGSVMLHYVRGKAKTNSIYGDGEISTDGYGLGGALTWYADNGFYVDGQAQATWYDSDLDSTLAGLGLADGNNGFGYSLSLESGKRVAIDQNWSVTPQAQLVYSNVDFDSFRDVFDASVSLDRGESLQGRLGVAVERQHSWYNENGLVNRTQFYGIGNLFYEFLNGTRIDVAGTSFANSNERLWGGVGIGGSYNWDGDKYSIYGEGSVNTSLAEFGDSYSYKGNIGFRVKW